MAAKGGYNTFPSTKKTRCFLQLLKPVSPHLDTPCAKADANLAPDRAIRFRVLQRREKPIDILLERHRRDSIIRAPLQRIGLVSMRSVQAGVDIRRHHLHHIHHVRRAARTIQQLHPEYLAKGGDSSFGGAVGWVKGYGEVSQRGAGEEDGRLSARLGQGEEVRSKGMRDQDRRRQVRGDFCDDFHFVGRLLEEHVMSLDPGVDKDGIQFGEFGQDTRDLALELFKIGQIPL